MDLAAGARFRGFACLFLLCSGANAASALDPCSPEFDADTGWETFDAPLLTLDLPPAGRWRVVSREAGARIQEGCGVGVIEAPIDAVRRVIDDPAAFDEFMPRVLESEVEPVSPGVYLNRQVLDMPFPARDRRYTVQVEGATFEVRGGSGSGWRARWSYVQGSGNIRESAGSWTLIPVSPERTVVVYQVLTDPGGRLPAWMVDRAAPRTLRRALEAVRQRVLSGR